MAGPSVGGVLSSTAAASQGAAAAARIVGLCVRPVGAAEPQRVDAAHLLAGVGLEGDRHASPRSPRQVLIASSRTYHRLGLPPLALRENILIDGAIDTIASGDRLCFGGGVELVAMFRCEPCGRLDRRRPGLASAIGDERGVLARVTHAGVLRAGDALLRRPSAQPLWSDDWRERVRQVLQRVPDDRWITYGRLAELAGVATATCRAFPRLLSSLPPRQRERARPASSACASGAPWDGDGLHSALLQAAQAAGPDGA